MSERALAYSEEPLSHRFLVIYEAVGIRREPRERRLPFPLALEAEAFNLAGGRESAPPDPAGILVVKNYPVAPNSRVARPLPIGSDSTSW
jgi:hypothetical protein